MLLVVEWYFNDLEHNLQMTVSLEVIFSFLDGNPKFFHTTLFKFSGVMLSSSAYVGALLPAILYNAERHDARR